MTTTLRSPLPRSASAPLRPSSRYRVSSVLESALVVHGRADAVVRSTRKPTKKRFLRDEEGGNNAANELERAASAPAGHQQGEEDDEDSFVRLRLRKTRRSVSKKKKNPEKEANTVTSPAVTRSAAKVKHRHAGVLEISGRTPMTRSMTKKWKPSRSSLEQIEDAEEEVDDVQIQKRLFASPERKTTQSKAHKQVAGKHKHEKKRKLQEEEGRGVHAGEKKRKKNLIASKGTRTPPHKATKTEDGRVKRKALVLHHWRVEWPPTLVQEGDSETDRRLQLVLIGQVDGASARFVVEKREGSTRFTSSEGEYVALPGGLDRDAARSAGMPRAAMELLKEGVPSFFKTSLLPFAQQRSGPIKPSKPEPKLMQKKRVPKEVKRVVAKSEPGGGSLKRNKKVVRVTSEPESEPEAEAEPSKPKKRARSAVSVKEKKKSVKQNQPEPKAEAEVDVWTSTQLQALTDAKMKIPTTASNFWAQVAQFVSGKSASDCQRKTFERFKSPPVSRKPSNKPAKRVATAANAAAEIKIARAGSNKFKKQVRDFVEEYEKKHVDDLFEMSTPSKDELPESVEFDSLKSPGAELTTPSRSFNDDDSDNDDDMPGMLKKLSSRRRDDVDSYVLGINRQHVAGGGVMAGGKVRRLTAPVTPVPTLKAKKKVAKKKAVHLVEECGSHYLEGVVSPGGTAHVRVEKDGSSSEDEEEDDYRSSGAESSCDFA